MEAGCAGMAIATLFVTMPFVARELIPVLEAMDMAEEEAALTLGASKQEVFWNVTLPNMRWGLMYGIILTNAVSSPSETPLTCSEGSCLFQVSKPIIIPL